MKKRGLRSKISNQTDMFSSVKHRKEIIPLRHSAFIHIQGLTQTAVFPIFAEARGFSLSLAESVQYKTTLF